MDSVALNKKFIDYGEAHHKQLVMGTRMRLEYDLRPVEKELQRAADELAKAQAVFDKAQMGHDDIVTELALRVIDSLAVSEAMGVLKASRESYGGLGDEEYEAMCAENRAIIAELTESKNLKRAEEMYVNTILAGF